MSISERTATAKDATAAPAAPSRRFPATLGRFDAPTDRALIDGLVRWIEERYAEDLAKRPSKHVYVGTLPTAAIAKIDCLRDSPIIRDLIAAQVPAGSTIAPMKHTDELYLSHYNKDRGGDPSPPTSSACSTSIASCTGSRARSIRPTASASC
jgi:hypothetical protein